MLVKLILILLVLSSCIQFFPFIFTNLMRNALLTSSSLVLSAEANRFYFFCLDVRVRVGVRNLISTLARSIPLGEKKEEMAAKLLIYCYFFALMGLYGRVKWLGVCVGCGGCQKIEWKAIHL